MEQDCWCTWSDRGLLICPDPIARLTDVIDADFPVPPADIAQLESIAAALPQLLEAQRLRATLDDLPMLDFSPLAQHPPAFGFAVIERLHQIYGFFATAYVYAAYEQPAQQLPAEIAVPLHVLSRMVERPAILAYCDTVLNNWRRIDPNGPIALDNLMMLQPLLGTKDESGFILVHANVEAQATPALLGIREAANGARDGDGEAVEHGLRGVIDGLNAIMQGFALMPGQCDPNIYYRDIRPYYFGFNDMVYRGVSEFNDQPQMYRGQSGAQSSIIPILVAGLNIAHERSAMTEHLDVMKLYMPKPHREFIVEMEQSTVREFVRQQGGTLADVYNTCLDRMIAFRRMHFHYATEYIFKRVENPIGTGGTNFMDWLTVLIDETARHRV
jgi:indoleamine 2,3-dioxygenase